jgi:hypothetical protein
MPLWSHHEVHNKSGAKRNDQASQKEGCNDAALDTKVHLPRYSDVLGAIDAGPLQTGQSSAPTLLSFTATRSRAKMSTGQVWF